MNTGFKTQCVPGYRVLTEDQIKEIHYASLHILETVGVRVLDEEGVQLLSDARCRVKKGDIVLIPNWLVEECIQSAPSRITIYNRKGEEAMQLEGNKVYFGLGTDLIQTSDLETGELRPSRLQDVINAARVSDYLEEIDFIASFGLPHDVPTNTMYIECFKAMVENSVKPIFFTAAGEEDLSVIFDMAERVIGEGQGREKPFLIHYSEPTSPLTHSKGAVRKLFRCASRGIPINYTPGMMSGGSGPVTLAGAISLANAEALSGIVLHQLKAKGAPIISGFVATPIDMRYSTISYGAPEFRLAHGACSDLYHYYGIPMWGTAGCSDAHCIDEQAAMEASMTILLAALEGANLVHDIGYLGQGLTGSPATIVMCSEVISYVKRLVRGFDLSPERMGLDVIRRVGPGGNFLAEDQTVKFHRTEHWRPRWMNRRNPEEWAKQGKRTYGETLIQKAREILEAHRPEPLSEAVRQDLEELARKADLSLKGKDLVA